MRKHNHRRAEPQQPGEVSRRLDPPQASLLSAHLGVSQQTLRHLDVIAQHLQQDSMLLDLVTIQLYQQLIKIYGAQLDQQITSETILTEIKNLVVTQFDHHQLWRSSAQEIWSSLVLRTIQDMQRDLGNSVLESLDWEAFNRILFQYLFESSRSSSTQSETIEQRIRYLEEFYAHSIACQIVENLNLTRQPVLVLKRLLGLQSPGSHSPLSAPQPPLPYSPPIAEIPGPFPTLSQENAAGEISFVDQLQADLWDTDARSMAYLRFHAKHNRHHYLEHYIATAGDLELLPWEAAEQILHKFGLQALKLHFILAAQAMTQPLPWQGAFRLRATEAVACLGWSLNPTSLHQLSALAYALSCLLVKCVCIEGQDAHASIQTPLGKLWELLIVPQGRFDWTTGRIETPQEVLWTLRAGLWSEGVAETPVLTQALLTFGQVALQLRKLNAYVQDLPLRLLIHLMLNTRIRASQPQPFTYPLKPLLEALFSEPIVQQAQAAPEQAQALFAQFSQALELLAQLGWSAQRHPAVTPAATPALSFYLSPCPRWLDPLQHLRKPRGWFNSWLDLHLTLIPPAYTMSQPSEH